MTHTTLRDRAATAIDRTHSATGGIHTERSRATLAAWLDGAIKLPSMTVRICAEYLESVADCNGGFDLPALRETAETWCFSRKSALWSFSRGDSFKPAKLVREVEECIEECVPGDGKLDRVQALLAYAQHGKAFAAMQRITR